jgi:hypothetical protein
MEQNSNTVTELNTIELFSSPLSPQCSSLKITVYGITAFCYLLRPGTVPRAVIEHVATSNRVYIIYRYTGNQYRYDTSM